MKASLLIRLGMLLGCGFAVVFNASADEASKPPQIVQRAISAYEANLRGIVGMQRHFSTLIDAGIVKHSEVSDSAILFKDGVFEKLHYYRIIEDGKEFSETQLSDRDKQSSQGWSSGKVFFKEPYDRRFSDDYAFSVPACTECATGTVAVNFTSEKRDAQHGAGRCGLILRANAS